LPGGVPGAYRALRTGSDGSVWAQLGSALFVSRDSGVTFESVNAAPAQTVHRFALGIGREPGGEALYVLGTMADERTVLLRSEDGGQTFAQFAVEGPLYNAHHLCADRQTFGRVYAGMNGRGVWVGEPVVR
jgi:hypothetical protein